MTKPPRTFEEYGRLFGPEMQRRAKEAGCKTVAEMVDWVDKHYGDRPKREQNCFRAPGRLRKAD